ncbi:hypothetical protein AVEN_236631-1 [Araneus ventricosus]|uniref:Uncharacterized protein n=1 Tax=Araneus ventricosus TaxID=182803 RepID=A0A4Y2AG31_ARAVE|nr:hypothetical protein AVEN_236631-1 [Araneus ventricosus]
MPRLHSGAAHWVMCSRTLHSPEAILKGKVAFSGTVNCAFICCKTFPECASNISAASWATVWNLQQPVQRNCCRCLLTRHAIGLVDYLS